MLDIKKREERLDQRINQKTKRQLKLKTRAEKLLKRNTKIIEQGYNEGYDSVSINFLLDFNLPHFKKILKEKYPKAIKKILIYHTILEIWYIPSLNDRLEQIK